ncbi:PREDICTED: protein EFR3 homolog B-like [Dinoponera quadriceps]|uniref:Protein EFR3 homolog B-like n=1 Tax=Dinoponera quadriceps TaxID=609295 RepID=A0A6P3XY98_DINQU|nr:PREDICTED: protein EFR3 homolog B-like [Dinoponera quadriceps]
MITREELAQRISEVSESCLSVLSPTTVQQDKILNKITRIVRDATKEQLLSYNPRALVMCMLKIMLRYEDLLREDRLCKWKRRRRFRLARDCYHDLLRIYLPERSRDVVEAVVETVYRDRLWEFETFCHEVICSLLDISAANGGLITHAIWDKLLETSKEEDTFGVEDARGVIRVLQELLDVHEWPATEDTLATVDRILELFYTSIVNSRSVTTTSREEFTSSAPFLASLKKSLEVCLRNTIKHLPNEHLLLLVQRMCSWTVAAASAANDEIVLEFGSTLEYAAYMHRTGLYEHTLTPAIFPLLMQMVGSASRLTSLLGNRVLQYLLDRRDNRVLFDTPRLFFEHTHVDLRIAVCRKEDRVFLKLHRESLHDSLLRSLLIHSESRMNLETTYCTVCLIAVEIPCGFTAATLVCLAMNLQEITLQQQKSSTNIPTFHIHATIISVMSLLCWIHQAKVFYSYVNRIMMERAKWAPHLNPPVQSQYSFAVHHVLWKKPELFFVDWQTRYGLWKCFRLGDKASLIDEL